MAEQVFEGRAFAALLFDMDGTLLSSTGSAERVWGAWARRHGLDVDAFLPTIHGVRAIETVRRAAIPGLDPEREAAAITQAEIADSTGVRAIAGVARFLAALPEGRWAIVTSAPRALAEARLSAAGLPMPEILVSAEDVADGKPDPACYRLAASRLGVEAGACLVFEDAEAGIAAAEAAGAAVLVVVAGHTRHPAIADFEDLVPSVAADGGISVSRGGASASASRA